MFLGIFLPFVYHAGIIFLKVLAIIMVVVSVIKFFSGQICAKLLLGSLILNLSTIAVMASLLIYPNLLVVAFSPVAWVVGIVFMIIQVAVVLLLDHPILNKFKLYFQRRMRWV
jgi:cellulose synthase/poly-beta-1,6-N-acetylglucosamine synthase-like glycosyltransferase